MTGYNFNNYEETDDLPETPTLLRKLIKDKLQDEDFVSNRKIRQHIGKQEQVEHLSEDTVRTLLSEILNWMKQQNQVEVKEKDSGSHLKEKHWKLRGSS